MICLSKKGDILKKKKIGFTLAEVLITLGIIGVVAAMTIPTLIANTNSARFRSKFKKTISTLSQAARMSQEQYDFDFAGVDSTCGSNGKTQNPENVHTICAMLNGTLTGATFYNTASDIKIQKAGRDVNYTITSEYANQHGIPTNMNHAYVLSDGTIVMIEKLLGSVASCHIELGEKVKDIYPTDGNMRYCEGFIDVNGISKPNKEVSCSQGSNSLEQNTCIVKNSPKYMTDVFPIRFHDGIVEPATAAGRYILQTAK